MKRLLWRVVLTENNCVINVHISVVVMPRTWALAHTVSQIAWPHDTKSRCCHSYGRDLRDVGLLWREWSAGCVQVRRRIAGKPNSWPRRFPSCSGQTERYWRWWNVRTWVSLVVCVQTVLFGRYQRAVPAGVSQWGVSGLATAGQAATLYVACVFVMYSDGFRLFDRKTATTERASGALACQVSSVGAPSLGCLHPWRKSRWWATAGAENGRPPE
jgi:hypothetical protein